MRKSIYPLIAAIIEFIIGAVILIISVVFCFTDAANLVKWIITAVLGTGVAAVGVTRIIIYIKIRNKNNISKPQNDVQ